MNDDDLWPPTPTVMDATRHTSRAVWRPGENWRGVALVNAILDAGEIRCLPARPCSWNARNDAIGGINVPGSAHSTNPSGTVGEIMGGTHTADMSENELLGMPNRMDAFPSRPATGNLRADIDCLPTPTSNKWNGGIIEPARRAAMGHAVTVADYAEKSTDIEVGGDSRLFSTPNCMDMIAPRSGRALEYVLRRGDPKRGMAGSTGNLREDVMMRYVTVLPTPTSRDGKGRNQRNTDDCMPVAADNMSITVPGPYHGGLWGLDDGRGVRFGRFTAAIRRWERVSGRPAPCPTQATGGLRRWAAANQADPTLFDPWWLACHTPFDAHPKARLDQPMRDRMLARWRETDRGMSLIDPMFWPGCKDMDPDIPIPATRLPDKSVLDYWKTRSVGSRFPSAAHLSPRFVEWMMGLEDGWVTNPAIWRHVDGNHRNLQLRALGNGVVPPQAAMAVDWALRVRERLAV